MTCLALHLTMLQIASCISFFKFLIYFQLYFAVESWKMKVCMNGTIYETSEHKCRQGIWFVEPKRISNICFERGIWAIYRDWCDKPIIWSVRPGTKGCVNRDLLTSKTLGIIYMGNEQTGSLMYTTSRRLFLDNEALQKGKLLEFVDAMDFEVLVWGSDLYGLDQKNSRSSSEQSCLIKGLEEFYGRYGFDIPFIMNVSMFLKRDLCRGRNYKGTRKQVIAKSLNFPIYESFNNSNAMKCVRYQEPLIGNEDAVEVDEDPAEVIQEKIDQQSQRLAFKMFHYRFRDEEVPDLDFEEWRFLKTGMDIFKEACPREMVSDLFLNNILVMFQFMLQESFLLFAPIIDQDSKLVLRIRDALSRCKANATLMDFTNTAVCSKDSPLLQIHSKESPTSISTKLVELPKHIRLNAEKFDLILETMWKLMIFVHYYCAESFQEYSSDLSVLQNRWQSLLAPDIIRRWKNPGLTKDMMLRIFKNTNLHKTLKNIDYCVAVSQMYSPYKGWLKRPLTKWDHRERNASKADLMWDGHAYCVNSFAYPAQKLGYPIEKCGIRYL